MVVTAVTGRSLKVQLNGTFWGRPQLGITPCKALVMLRSLVRLQLAPPGISHPRRAPRSRSSPSWAAGRGPRQDRPRSRQAACVRASARENLEIATLLT